MRILWRCRLQMEDMRFWVGTDLRAVRGWLGEPSLPVAVPTTSFSNHTGHPRRSIASTCGSALIIVLWAILLLAFAVGIASERVALIMGDTSIQAKRFQAELLADSALASLDRILKEEHEVFANPKAPADGSRRKLNLPRFQGTWRSPPTQLENGAFRIELRDEQSRINWLKTPSFVWRNLFRMADVPPETADAWLDALADWQDADDARALNGAETLDYQNSKDNRRRAKNAPITAPGELHWIMGGPEMLALKVPVDSRGRRDWLRPMTTIYGDGRININTAPAILVAAALDVPLEQAEAMVRRRWGPDGKEGTHDDLFVESVPVATDARPMADQGGADGRIIAGPELGATTRSSLFRVRGIGIYQGQRVVREALAVRKDEYGLRLLDDPIAAESGSCPMETGL